jgi:hypothetical protein
MEKADFYVGLGLGAEWIGSVRKYGEITSISTPIFLQVNQVMYEELVFEYIRSCEGIIANHICQWPWEWMDSRMTDYSYFFDPETSKVYVSIEGGYLLDPIKLLQGEDLITANTMLGCPDFPTMIECVCYEDSELYG